MSWHYTQAAEADSSERGSSDGPRSARWKSSPTAEKSSCGASGTVCSRCSQSGTTSELSQKEISKSVKQSASYAASVVRSLSRADSPVNRTQPPGSETANGTAGISGPIPSESFAKWDRDTCFWRTSQVSLITNTLERFSANFRKAGIAFAGRLYRLPRLEHPIGESGSGLLPTPTGTSARSHVTGRIDEWGGRANRFRGSMVGKMHLPDFEAWMMGWPEGWQKLTPLDKDKFREWLEQHGCI